jgi:hypothetical protein
LKVFVGPKAPLTFGNTDEAPTMNGASPHMNNDYENACEQIRQENARFLDDFVSLLRSQRLAPSTVKKHRDNVDFFINEFLLYEDAKSPDEGIGEVDAFLGDWFIRKAMWSTPSAIKSNATSLYKFYAFMAALDRVTPSQLAELQQTIVRCLPVWQAMCERYSDPDIENWRGMD